jgi:exosortase/archaeosortase family protein
VRARDFPVRAPLGRVLVFLAALALLSAAEVAVRDTPAARALIGYGAVQPAAAVVALVAPDTRVRADAHRMVGAHASLAVLPGCDGLESWVLLAAALCAAPLHWRRRALGLALATVLVAVLNVARLTALFVAAQTDRELFALLHGYVAPFAIVACSAVFLGWWIGALRARP